MLTAPPIETPRLRLRAARDADFETVAAFLASDRAVFIGGPFSRGAAWRGFAATVGSWALRGYGYWGVEERETGTLAGAVGFMGPPIFPEIELGWDLYDPRFEGRGFATEAARAARDWGFGAGIADSFLSVIHPRNDRSMRVAERLGAARDPDAGAGDPEDVVYRHRRETAR